MVASLGLVESEYKGPYKTDWPVKADTRMHDAGSCLTISCKTVETSVCIARKAIQKISAPKQNTTQKADHPSGLRTFSKISVTTYYPRFWLFSSQFTSFCFAKAVTATKIAELSWTLGENASTHYVSRGCDPIQTCLCLPLQLLGRGEEATALIT